MAPGYHTFGWVSRQQKVQVEDVSGTKVEVVDLGGTKVEVKVRIGSESKVEVEDREWN